VSSNESERTRRCRGNNKSRKGMNRGGLEDVEETMNPGKDQEGVDVMNVATKKGFC